MLLLERLKAERAQRQQRLEDVTDDADAVRERCKTLHGFVKEAWPVLEPGTQFVDNWHLSAICEHLQAVTYGQITRLQINVPPGSMKSLLASVFWESWEWGPAAMPWLRYLGTSYDEDYARRDSRRMRDLVQSSWYQALWPIELTRFGEGSFENTMRGGREAKVFANLTGGRGNRVICLPANQRILTDRGWLPIGEIVERELEVRIAGYDGTAVRWQSIEAFERNPAGELFDITAGGRTVRCTSDHPVFVSGRGWVKAETVKIGEAAVGLAYDGPVQGLRQANRISGNCPAPILQHPVSSKDGARGEYARLREVWQTGLQKPCEMGAGNWRKGLLLLGLFGAQRLRQPGFHRWKSFAELCEVWCSILAQRQPVKNGTLLFTNMRLASSLGSTASANAVQTMPEMFEGVQTSGRAQYFLLSGMLQRSPCGTNDWLRKWAVSAWRGRKAISARLVAQFQGEDSRAGWQCLPRLRESTSNERANATRPSYRLREEKSGPAESDHSLQVLPWNDAWLTGSAPRVDSAIVSNVERVGYTGEPTYNLRVGPDHCYFAEGLLLHNCDDPHSVDTAESVGERMRVTRRFRESLQSRLNDPKKDAIIVIMQRLHEKDVCGVIEELGLPYTKLILPMEFEKSRRCITHFGGKTFSDPRTKEGELLDPGRFPQDVVDRLKQSMGAHAWSGQYQQRPTAREGGLFKRQWFQIVDAVPSEATRKVRRWDLAATIPEDGNDPDWTVGLKMSTGNGNFYIEDVIYFRDVGASVRRSIKATAALDGRKCQIIIPQDPGQAGKDQAKNIISENAGYRIGSIRETGEKGTRAEPFAAQLEAGNVYLVRGPWNETFIDQLCGFPVGHDDMVDAASGAFTFLAGTPGPLKITADILNRARTTHR